MIERAEEAGLQARAAPSSKRPAATPARRWRSISAVKGYKCVFVMPDKMSQEKIASLRAFGARVVVCPTAVEPDDPRSYYSGGRRIAEETPNCVLRQPVSQPRQPRGPLPRARGPRSGSRHRRQIDVFVAGMGTGGTISGVRQVPEGEEARHAARRRRPGGLALLRLRQERAHHQALHLQGRGHRRGLLPLDDEPQDHRRDRARRRQGVLLDDARLWCGSRACTCGGSSGAAVAGAIKYARKRRQEAEHPGAPRRTARTSTSPRSSTTIGCARTASWTISPASGPWAIFCKAKPSTVVSANVGDKVRDVVSTAQDRSASASSRCSITASCAGSWPRSTLLRHLVGGGYTLD